MSVTSLLFWESSGQRLLQLVSKAQLVLGSTLKAKTCKLARFLSFFLSVPRRDLVFASYSICLAFQGIR